MVSKERSSDFRYRYFGRADNERKYVTDDRPRPVVLLRRLLCDGVAVAMIVVRWRFYHDSYC